MKRTDVLLIAVVVGYLVLGMTYSLVTPVFEASDELNHYPVVKHIADGQGLPVQDPAAPMLFRQEGSQPPLYYALAALITAPIDTGDMAALRWRNPHATIGRPLDPGNKNMIVHTGREAFPWAGTVLAVHLIRFLSVLLQGATVLLAYALACEVVPSRRDLGVAAAALVAFNPMFLFITASVNNDNLIVPLAALAVWLLARTLRQGWLGFGRAIALGVILGLAALTKLSGLGLLPLTAAVLVVVAWRQKAWDNLLRWGIVVGAPVLLIAGWWYLRNLRLYGDPTGLNFMLDIARRRRQTPSWRQLLGEFEGFYISYWGLFGGVNVLAPNWVYRLYGALAMAGLCGWMPLAWRYSRRWREGRVVWLPVAWVGIVFAALVNWTRQTAGSQGRLLFPAIGALSVLLVYGLAGWLPRRWQGRGLAGVAASLALLAAIIPFWVIAPAYAKPPLLTADQVPSTATPVDVVHGGTLRLLAYELPVDTVHPGESLPVTLYWQSVAQTDRDLSLFVHLIGREGELAGQSASYPGEGAYATSQLRPGDILRDTYYVPVQVAASAPSLLRVDAGLFEYQGGGEEGLPATDSAGRPTSGTIGSARLLPGRPPEYEITRPQRFDLGGRAALVGYDLGSEALKPGETLDLTLFWQASTRIPEDYTVFVHLVGADGELAFGNDKPPLDGDWPTHAWEPGYTVRDGHPLSLPEDLAPGVYELRVGLYRPGDGWRLPVTGPDGGVRDNAIILGRVVIR